MLRSIEPIVKRGLAAAVGFVFPSRPPREAFPKNLQRILVIRQHNQLGDMLCVVPLLRALHAAYPGARISLMTSPVNHNVMWHNRYLADTILFDKREFLQGKVLRLGKLMAFAAKLRHEGFQIALVPSTISTSFTSDLMAFLSGAPIRVGAKSLNGRANPSAFFFNVPVTLDWRQQPHRHQTLRNMDILTGSGISTSDLSLDIALDEDEDNAGKSFVDKLKTAGALVIGYNPGAGKPPNRWPAERFAKLIDLIAGHVHATALVTGGPMDMEQLEEVQRAVKTPIEISRNHPIRQLASILRHLDLYVTNDTGLMHVAAGVGVPVLSLFGPTDPGQWAPMGEQNRYLYGEGGDITNISVEQVFSASMDMLARLALSEERK